MANKTLKYTLSFCFKVDGNRGPRYQHDVAATTVQRAISKVARDINDGIWESRSEDNAVPDSYDEDYEIRSADLLVLQAVAHNL